MKKALLLTAVLLTGCRESAVTPAPTPSPVPEPTPLPTEVDEVVPASEPREQPTALVRNSKFNTAWDSSFEKWTQRYLPFHKYTLLKAQCYQESLLDPNAESYVGAKGLCQFMDYTWEDVRKPLKLPLEASAFDPELSIQAAAYYDARIRSQWKSKRPEYDRMNLTFASYNAGMGHILKAQKACGGKSLYNEIIVCLPQITGHHSKETRTYVERIRRWETEMNLEN